MFASILCLTAVKYIFMEENSSLVSDFMILVTGQVKATGFVFLFEEKKKTNKQNPKIQQKPTNKS